MSTDGEEQRASDERLQRRLGILKEQLKAGKVKFAQGLQVIDSLKRVRYAPDGSVDLDTVDGLVRSAALAIEYMHDREALKKALPLEEIQKTYFEFIEQNFGFFFKIMKDRGLTPHDAGLALSQQKSTIKELTQNLPDFLNTLREFWEQTGDAARAHLEDMQPALKGIFGGDLFPSHDENIASRCGLYMDTVILPDPFLRSQHIFDHAPPNKHAYYLIKHALNILQYKELACSSVAPPIVAVLPDTPDSEDNERNFILELGKADALMHASQIFNRNFESFQDFVEYCSSLRSIDDAERVIVHPERVLFDTDWGNSARQQLERASQGEVAEMMGENSPGMMILSAALGRMATSNELLIKARRLRGSPIIDAPTSWQYFVWKLEYDADRMENSDENLKDSHLHAIRGIGNVADTEFEWLGNIPPAALIEIREQGALDEIRRILSTGIDELVEANPTNFHRTSDQVFDNIERAFSEHRRNVETLRQKRWKFAGSDIGSWLVVGSFAVAAAATGTPFWGLGAIAADQLLDAPKLKDIPQSIKGLAEENRKLQKSPVGILFNASKEKA